MANYAQELKNFKQQWNLPGYDLDKLAQSVQALRFADSFLMGGYSDNTPASQYVKWFSRTLSLYFSSNTLPNENGKYMSSFDAQEFYDSFKSLVQAKYDADAQEKNEVPLQVGEVVTDDLKPTIQNTIANCKRNYKKTLPALWQENLKKGIIDMQNLKNITSQAYEAIDKKYYVNENEFAGELTNIVAAREAMQQLRASRSGVWGWLWKVIFNRTQNRQEKEYLQQLDDQIAALTEKGYKLAEITRNLTEKTVLGKDVNAKTETTKTQDKQVEQTKAKVEVKAIQPVASQISEMANSEYLNNLATTLHAELPGNNMVQFARVWQYSAGLSEVFKTVKDLNENFDRAVENGADPKKEMAKVVYGVFKETEKVFSQYMIETGLDKMEGLKIAAQVIIDNLTVAAIYPDELSDAVNTYMEQNLAIYEEIVSGGKKYSEEIGNYKKMLEEDVVSGEYGEPVFGKDNPFVESNVNKSAPISQQPQISVPKLDK